MVDSKKIRNVFDEFTAVQIKYRNFGAYDSEPEGVFQGVVFNLCKNKDIKLPTTWQEWELYERPGSDSAAFALTITLHKVCEFVRNSSRDAKEFILRTYCWRYT